MRLKLNLKTNIVFEFTAMFQILNWQQRERTKLMIMKQSILNSQVKYNLIQLHNMVFLHADMFCLFFSFTNYYVL